MNNHRTDFQTEDLPFACFLLTSNRLRFLGCRDGQAGRITFSFDDPQSQGEELRIEYESGALVPAVAYYDSMRRLRRLMTQTREKGERNNGTNQY